MTVFLSSDQHLSHFNIIRYTSRPFVNTTEMDRMLVERWNERVKPEDTVIHLGDISFGRYPQVAHNVKKLNGKITIIKGNHDKGSYLTQLVKDGLIVDWKQEDKRWVAPDGSVWYLAHHPLPGVHKQICGHIHQHWKVQGWKVNVGVDVWNFYPVTIGEIQTVMKHKEALGASWVK